MQFCCQIPQWFAYWFFLCSRASHGLGSYRHMATAWKAYQTTGAAPPTEKSLFCPLLFFSRAPALVRSARSHSPIPLLLPTNQNNKPTKIQLSLQHFFLPSFIPFQPSAFFRFQPRTSRTSSFLCQLFKMSDEVSIPLLLPGLRLAPLRRIARAGQFSLPPRTTVASLGPTSSRDFIDLSCARIEEAYGMHAVVGEEQCR